MVKAMTGRTKQGRRIAVRAVSIAAALLIAVGVVSPVALAAAPAVAQQEIEWNEELATCMAVNRHLLAVFLVDESGSLDDTDPNDERVSVVRLGIASLRSMAERLNSDRDGAVQIEVAVLGFASQAVQRVPWTSPDEALKSEGLTGMSERDNGRETDYVNALIGARDAFAQRAGAISSESGIDPCKIMFWFTDGKFDIVTRGASAQQDEDVERWKEWAPDIDLFGPVGDILERGRAVICDATDYAGQGIADQLRDAGVIGIALALTKQIDPADRDFLVAISENPADNSCGAVEGIGRTTGSDDFIRLGCELASPLDGTSVDEECQPLPEAELTLFGDPGMDRVSVVVVSPADLRRVILRSPSGEEAEIPSGRSTTERAGATVEASFTSGRELVLDVDFNPSSTEWVGEWNVAVTTSDGFADGDHQVTYWGDYSPSVGLHGDEPLRIGDPGLLQIDVVTSAGAPVDAATFVAFDLDVASGDPNLVIGQPRRQGQAFVADLSTADAQIGRVPVTATITATTKSGIALEPVSREGFIELSPPPGYPVVTTTKITPPTLVGPGTVPFTIVVEGPPETDGCVWFDGLTPDESANRLGPQFDLAPRSSMSVDDCVKVPAGETIELEGDIVVSEAGQGRFGGTIDVKLQARPEMEVLPAGPRIEFNIDRPIDTDKRNWLFALMFGAGLLIPLLITALVNQYTARFRTGDKIKHLIVSDLVVTPNGLQTVRGGPVAPVDRSGFELGPGTADRARRFRIDPFVFTARASVNPFAAPIGQAQVERSAVFSNTSGAARSGKKTDRARTDLVLPRQWFFAAELQPTSSEAREAFETEGVPGTLLVVVALSDETEADVLASDAADKVPSLVAAAIDSLPEAPPAGPPVPPRDRTPGDQEPGATEQGPEPQHESTIVLTEPASAISHDPWN